MLLASTSAVRIIGGSTPTIARGSGARMGVLENPAAPVLSGENLQDCLSRALDAMGVPGDTDHVRAAIAKYGEALGNRAQGRINAEEFAKLTRDLVAAQQTERALAALAPESYKQAFDRFDTDRSGTIDAAELARALDSMGVKHAGASAILQRYDQHDAPSLDLTEYSDLVRDLISYQQRQLLPKAGAERVRQMFAHHDASKHATSRPSWQSSASSSHSAMVVGRRISRDGPASSAAAAGAPVGAGSVSAIA